MTTAAGSAELQEIASRLIELVDSLEARLVERGVMHMKHSDLCTRAAQFSDYLAAALLLAERRCFPQAFSLLRSALDHWAADLVIMLGDRFVQYFDNASEDTLKDVVERWRRGELSSVIEEPCLAGRARTKLRIVRRGLISEDGTMVLHPMYFEASKFDPFFGPPDEQADFADWLGETDARDYATLQRQTYNAFFKWGALVDSLVLNDLVDHRHRIHLNVHHRFLSAFVHSHHGAHELLTRTPPGINGLEPHATEELVLLYSVQFGARYLLAFLEMAERPPEVEVAERAALQNLATVGLGRASHLWFLDDEPQLYDRGQEALARVAVKGAVRPAAATEALTLAPEDIRYYRNPLDRLRQMHRSATEIMTGFTYVSPWT